jgi:hypothetical protein
MHSLLPTLFQNYSYLSDEVIFSHLLKKLSKKEKDELENLHQLFNKLNKHIDIKIITQTLSKLESNYFIIDQALKDNDDELSFHIRVLNQYNQKLITEIFTMLDNRELVEVEDI